MDTEPPRAERRNLLLRMLIDDMLTTVREMQRHAGPWSPEERARAETDLDRILSQVRSEAMRRSAT